MYAKRATDYSGLNDDARAAVQIARQANADTYSGGAGAMVAAKDNADLSAIVSEVYAASAGKVPAHLDAWECGECGCTHYGKEAAEYCCSDAERADMEDEDADEDEETDTEDADEETADA